MTDLERLWDDYPTGRPPVEAVLRDAHRTRGTRRRRLLARPLVAATAFVALGAAFVAGTLVSGHRAGQTLPAPTPTAPSPVAFQADLHPATSCGQLRRVYVDRGLAAVTAWGWSSPVYLRRGAAFDGVKDLAAAHATAPTRQTDSATGTNVQEQAVDEPDTVKTDGSVLVRARHSELQVYDLTGARPRWVGSLPLPQLTGTQLLLSGDTVVALGSDRHSRRGAGSRVVTVSIADPTHPTVTGDVAYSSAILSARQHGTAVRLVLSAGLPDLDFVHPTKNRSIREALAANRRVVQRSTIHDWLPTYTTGGSAQPLLGCTEVAIPPKQVGLDTVSVVGFDAATPTSVTAIGLAGATTIAYESTDDLYLASTPWSGCGPMTACPLVAGPGLVGSTGGTTYLFDFALDGTSATHVASGRVDGTIADRWSMDAVGDSLRVAVQSLRGGQQTRIETFGRDGQRLVEQGRLGGLGRGESMESVRWFDDLAIVVTYRQVDPLYAVDLTDPRHPALLGRLQVSGYSAYLHPLGPDRMIGVGEGLVAPERWGAQIGLFDVSDLTHPRRLSVHHYAPGTYPLAESDPRSFTWLPSHRAALAVVERGHEAYLSVLRAHDGRLHNRMIPAGPAGQAGDVRTLPVPGGRFVLVAGDDVTFLDLA